MNRSMPGLPCSNSCPSSRWCHPAITSSVVPFSSCPQSFPASGSFQMSKLFASGGQSVGVSASISVLPMNTQDWSPLGWTGWISLQFKGLSRVFSNNTVQKHQFSVLSFLYSLQFSLEKFSHSVVSDSLWPHRLHHARFPCSSPTPGACSNSCPLSWWFHPTISSSVVPFSSCLQSFPALGSFPVSQFFASGGQSMGASALVFPMNIQDWFSLRLTGLISLLSKGLSRVFSNTTVQKHQFFGTQLSLWSNSHIHVSAVLKEAKVLYSGASGFFVVLYGKEPMDPLVIFPLPHISCNYQNIWYYVSVNKTLCKSSDTGPNKALLSWKSILYQEYVSITVKLNCFCFQNGMVQHS